METEGQTLQRREFRSSGVAGDQETKTVARETNSHLEFFAEYQQMNYHSAT